MGTLPGVFVRRPAPPKEHVIETPRLVKSPGRGSLIPKVLWQTWKSKRLEGKPALWHQTWVDQNPSFECKVCDDEECRAFVQMHFDKQILSIYDQLPLNVMRADLWRYLVIFQNGGVYADMDTSCLEPIDRWLGDAEIVIGVEGASPCFCQWTFASVSGHPVLEHVINEVCARVKDVTSVNFDKVLAMTGPFVFTKAVQKHLTSFGRTFPLPQRGHTLSVEPPVRQTLERDKMVVYPGHQFLRTSVEHHYSGQQNDAEHEGWVHELRRQKTTSEVFAQIYKKDVWTKGSGPGSTVAFCAPLVDFLVKYVEQNKVKSFCDLGCGDLQWVPGFLARVPDLQYFGVDCVPSLMKKEIHGTLINKDFSSCAPSELPDADLYFVKDVLQHWPSDMIDGWLKAFFKVRPRARLLTINDSEQGRERIVQVGGWGGLDGERLPLSGYDAQELFAWGGKKSYVLTADVDLESLSVYVAPLVKMCLGKNYDGGYVVCEAAPYDLLLSGGVSDDISFEQEFLARYTQLEGKVLDGTVVSLPSPCSRLTFERRNVISKTFLEDLLFHENVFVKMDIEGSEYEWLESLSDEALSHIKQMVIEFHRPRSWSVLSRLAKTHWLVHLHGNNFGSITTVSGVKVPEVFECTYLRKDGQLLHRNSTPFPTILDMPNDKNCADLVLQGFPFQVKS